MTFNIKPLEWDGNTGRAGTAFRYVIAEPDRTIGWRVWVSIGDQSPSFFLTARPENREAAVSFAEADYRNRIISALLPKATAPVVSEPVAWRCEDLILPNVSIIDDWKHAQARMRQPKAWRVTPLYASPQPEAVINEEMVERAAGAMLREQETNRSVFPDNRDLARAALTAALKED